MNRAQYILELLQLLSEDVGPGQMLPYSQPGFANMHPVKTQLRQSNADKYANRLRSIQRTRFFRKAISASWKTPKATTPNLTPSQSSGSH